MKCPHCLVHVSPKFRTTLVDGLHDEIVDDDQTDAEILVHGYCPNEDCGKPIVFFQLVSLDAAGDFGDALESTLIYPRRSDRAPAPSCVPKDIAQAYDEACLVLSDSPMASAALSRRCLQHTLREKGNLKKHGNLESEIRYVVKNSRLPHELAEDLDAVRQIGNFAAHPTKSKNTGEIMPVEGQEADWNLDVLEALFDFYYVQPAQRKAKRAALNEKLKEANKPLLPQ
jgi:Domain of unknown function (DUF4145)